MPSSGPDGWLEGMREGLRQHEQEGSPPLFRGTAATARLLAGRYELRSTLGEGAAALVYSAWDRELRRAVAVKILKETRSDVQRQRFRREAQSLAGLSHPSVVTIHDFGEVDGLPYLVMELVQGRPLSQILRERAFDLPSLLGVLEKVARGAAAVHERGIVHRDLKPGNILVTQKGEPKVADFGVAHLMDSNQQLTRTGTPLGTPVYMAPEQVRGRMNEIGPWTDVYALGATLYEMITGRPPHLGESAAEVYAKVVTEEPAAPSALIRVVPAELEAVCLKALERYGRNRYPTAREFGDDLLRYLSGEPVRARRLTPLRKTWRAIRRPAVLLTATIAGLIVVVTITAVTLTGKTARRSAVQQAAALEREGRLEEARDLYKAALAMHAGDTQARAGLERTNGELKARQSVREQAEHDAQRLLEQARPALEEAAFGLYDREARFDDVLRRVEAAKDLIAKAIEKAPHLPLGHYLMGRSLEIAGRYEESETSLRRAIELDAGFGPGHFQLARLLLQRSHLAGLWSTREERIAKQPGIERLTREAVEHFQAALAAGSGLNEELWIAMAESMKFYFAGDYQSFRGALERCISRYVGKRGSEEFHYLMSYALEGDGAVREFDRAIAVRPKYPMALLARGAVRYSRGDLQRAIADYTACIECGPYLPEAYFNRALALESGGNRDGAIADYTAALRLRPRFAMAYNNRANCLTSRGDFDAALADFKEALAIEPDLAIAYYNRGDVHRKRNESQAAVADYTEAIRLRPAFPEAYFNRAVARGPTDLPGAIADLEKALEVAPAGWRDRAKVEELLRQARQ